jgi:hypothetical protein
MTDDVDKSISQSQENAVKATADENTREIKKELELEETANDYVKPTSKSDHSSVPVTIHPNNKSKIEPPEMNIQLQR